MEKVKCQYLVIGAIERNGEWVACGSQEVEKQKQDYLRLAIHPDARFAPGDKAEGQPVTVDSYVGIISHIAGDRKLRVDRGILMANRPPIMVVAHSPEGSNGSPGEIIQIDVYSGHDFLTNDRHLGAAGSEADVPDFTDPADSGVHPSLDNSPMTENDQEAFSGIEMWFNDHRAYKGFMTLGSQKIYDVSRKLILASTGWERCKQVAAELGMPLGNYSVATWCGNVGDVFRAIAKGGVSEPATVDAWAKAIQNEFDANLKASGFC